MLNKQGFNLWAEDYDQTVQLIEENNQYPFAGYKQILNLIFNEIMQTPASKVLDIGFGTGVLTSKLYNEGHSIDGIDFSSEMIAIAQAKMPEANLIEYDIINGLPPQFKDKQYDAIVSTYALHHLDDSKKVSFITELLPLLKENGLLFIGDIAFQNSAALNACRQENSHQWDEDEFYFAFDELKATLTNHCTLEFHPISHCGGIIVISH